MSNSWDTLLTKKPKHYDSYSDCLEWELTYNEVAFAGTTYLAKKIFQVMKKYFPLEMVFVKSDKDIDFCGGGKFLYVYIKTFKEPIPIRRSF